jgi:lysophospholipase L1-like esterase
MIEVKQKLRGFISMAGRISAKFGISSPRLQQRGITLLRQRQGTSASMDQFLLFGDSITQQALSQDWGFAFGAALADTYNRKLDVVNRGLSGYNTRQALQTVQQAIPTPSHARLRFLTIFFGANDARLPDTPGGPQQHIPLEEYKQNVKAIIHHPSVTAHDGVRIILITPPPVDERLCLANDKAGDPHFPDCVRRKAEVTAAYAAAIREVGREEHVKVLDFWSALILRSGGQVDDTIPTGSLEQPRNETLQGFLRDGLHLSPEGYRALFDELMNLVGREYPDQIPDKLPFVLPRWDDADAWKSS